MILFGKIVYGVFFMLLTNIWIAGRYLEINTLPLAALFVMLLFVFVIMNIVPVWSKKNFTKPGVMLGGETLAEIALCTFILNIGLTVYYGVKCVPDVLSIKMYIIQIVLMVLFSAVLILNGGVRMFLTSVQLGIKWRVLMLVLWYVPLVNIFVICKICSIVRNEYRFELEKKELNSARTENEICKTKYPLVMVHGVFFRDWKLFNYWGRVPAELIRNGATVFYGNHQSAASHDDAAMELKERILQIIEETGCGKVNIIAHSKGGLECRAAISRFGLAPYVASLTTINTPHRGCGFVDWLLQKAPKGLYNFLSKRYNAALRKMGDTDPDFESATRDLTSKSCEAFNETTPDMPGILYQSVGSKMKNSMSSPFPLNLVYPFVRRFEKENDGLVGISSMKWGSDFIMLTPKRRGISHGDMIDLYRRNIRGFDVREFYVKLAASLKERGY